MLTCGSFLPFCFPASTARALLAGAMAAIQPVLCRLSNGQQCQNLESANLQALLCLPGSSYWWVPGVSAPSWSRPTWSSVTRPRPVLDNLLSHWFPNQLLATMACRKYVPAHVYAMHWRYPAGPVWRVHNLAYRTMLVEHLSRGPSAFQPLDTIKHLQIFTWLQRTQTIGKFPIKPNILQSNKQCLWFGAHCGHLGKQYNGAINI